MMLSKSCTQYVRGSGRPSSGHRTRKDQSSPQFPRRAVLKNAQTTGKLHSSPALIRLCSKSSKLGFSIMWTKKFQMFKLGLKKGRGTRDQIANICWIIEKAREFRKNIYLCFIDYIKALTVWIITSWGKLLKRWEYHTILPVSWETCMQVKKQQLEPDMEQWTPTLGKEYDKALYCHPANLTSMQSTSCKMPGWMNHKLESKFPEEISTASDMQMIPL